MTRLIVALRSQTDECHIICQFHSGLLPELSIFLLVLNLNDYKSASQRGVNSTTAVGVAFSRSCRANLRKVARQSD